MSFSSRINHFNVVLEESHIIFALGLTPHISPLAVFSVSIAGCRLTLAANLLHLQKYRPSSCASTVPCAVELTYTTL